jgi:hypothetical protein
MIPTRYKSKLPRYLSYPIGAEALTEGLAHALHVELFKVVFYANARSRHSEFQQTLTQKQPYSILIAEHKPSQKPGYCGAQFMIERGYYDEHWELTVYPVLRELRHMANGLLREQGLPLVVEWLRTSDRSGWRSSKQSIELIFNPVEETLIPKVSSGV